MVNHEHQDHNAAERGASEAVPPLSPKGASRRRIAGIGVSGVVMTVASNNAMAAMVCKSPSGALSGNLNSQKPNERCDGLSPGYWKNHAESWPGEVKPGDRFAKFFPTNGALATVTCHEVLKKQKADKNNVAMHIMATYLNVVTGRITFLTRQAVVNMWVKYDTYGTYTPTEGARPWSGEELTNYLSSTQS